MEQKPISDEEKKRRENDCKLQSLRYSVPTLMGNWQEDIAHEANKLKMFALKDQRCEIFLQAKNEVQEHLYAWGDIAKYNKYLLYEEPIQLKTDLIIPDVNLVSQMALSVNITEQQISADHKLQLYDGCSVTVSENTNRMRRNIFTIVSFLDNKSKTPVIYGEDVLIRVYDSGSHRCLYLQFVMPTVECFGGNRGRYSVVLSEIKNRYCNFKIVHYDLSTQDFKNGSPVPSNSRISIKHTSTNQYLAWENDQTLKSLFGTEKLASGYTYLNIHKQLISQNYWICVTKTIGEDEKSADTENDPTENSTM